MVSTDDEEIAKIAEHFGAKVPFYRSREISSDMAMTVPVLIQRIDYTPLLFWGTKFAYALCVKNML